MSFKLLYILKGNFEKKIFLKIKVSSAFFLAGFFLSLVCHWFVIDIFGMSFFLD